MHLLSVNASKFAILFVRSSSVSPDLAARISLNVALGVFVPDLSESAAPSASSSGFGDFAFAAAEAPKRVAAPEKDPNASLALGTEPLGAGEDPKTDGLPLRVVPNADGLPAGDEPAAAARKGEGRDAKAEKPLEANAEDALGGGDVVREGDLGVENLAKIEEDAPNAEDADFWRYQD